MDVQADAALEAMSETGSGAEGATGPASFATASSKSKDSLSSSSEGAMSLPPRPLVHPSSTNQRPNQTPQRGHPKEITVNPVEEKFLCGYCGYILREPLQSECGHRFCTCCRTIMQQLPQPVICQECVKEEMPGESCVLNLDAMFDDKAAIREMRKIPCKCINPGCSWKGLFHEYIRTHENSCDKKMLPCSLCGSVMSQNKLLIHETKQCPKRRVTCQYCQQEMLQEQEEKHQMTTCQAVPVKCEKCSTSVPRSEFETHQERDCIHRDIICPVPDCGEKMPKEHFPAHLNESPKRAQKHLLYLFDKISQLEQEMARVQIQPLPAVLNEHGVAASAEDARTQQASANASQAERHKANEAVGGAESGVPTAATEPQTVATLKLHEDLMSVLHGEILRCIRQVEAILQKRTQEAATVRTLTGKLEDLERSLGTVEMRVQELQPHVSMTGVGSLVECGDGVATWSIPQFSQVRRAAVNGTQCYINSPPFATGSLGYKMNIRLFPDGHGSEKGKALSVYLNLLPGQCDDLLPWPFQADVHFVLIDQKDFKQHKIASIRAPSEESTCKKPAKGASSPMGFGIESLVTIHEMGVELLRYNVNDVLYLRVLVDLKNPQLPGRLKLLDPRQQSSTNSRRVDGTSSRK